MKLNVKFSESKQTVIPRFGEIHNISDGGFDRGYAEGFTKGRQDGYNAGFTEGREEGFSAGVEQGHSEGYTEGYKAGYAAGYTAGYAKGKEDGHAEGFEAGAKSEYDRFWDVYQNNGNRTLYQHAFYGNSWTDDIFSPKYDIKSNGGTYDFANTFYLTGIKDLGGILERNGVVLDTSLAPVLNGTFQQAEKITSLPPIDMSSCVTANRTFYSMRSLKRLDIRNLREDCVVTMPVEWTRLTELNITGVIGRSGWNLQWATLPKDNFKNIINVLSATASGESITLSRSAVDGVFETNAGAADGSTSAEWIALINTKPNWTINLA